MSSWIIYSILCLLTWGIWGIFLKLSYRELSWLETYFISSLTSFSLALAIYLVYKGRIDFVNKQFYIILAGIAGLLGGGGYVFFVKAIESGKASIVIPLTALYPAITALLAIVFLGEKVSVLQAIGIVLAIVAAIILSIG